MNVQKLSIHSKHEKNMKYKINKNFIFQKIDKNMIGIDIDQSYLYTFNETAEFIFKKIKMGWGEEKITSTLVNIYKVDASVLKRDVQSIIKDLFKNRILLESS